MILHPFERAVQKAAQGADLLPGAGVVVVACSGGADSLALLTALHSICGAGKRPFSHVRLHVAHLDHGLRAESAADAAFVRDYAATLDLPCTVGIISPAERQEWHGISEAAAREARHRFLRRVAADVGAERIALGHTLDDQAETVLLHLIRGSGTGGLSGMRPRAGDLIRPLLGLRRAATESYCAARHLIPRDDATNRDPRFLRNRVRHEALPVLSSLQPDIATILARTADVLAADAQFLRDAAERAWQGLAPDVAADRVTLARADLRRLPMALRSRVLRRAIGLVGLAHPNAQLDANSITRLDRVIMDRSGSVRTVQLSTGAAARCDRVTVVIARDGGEEG